MSTQADIPVLHINEWAPNGIQLERPISLSVFGNVNRGKEAKAADRIASSCRENVRFLNHHLRRYDRFLELPALVDNALYLAYTIRVKENPYFTANDFSQYLNNCGIETKGKFSFAEDTIPHEVQHRFSKREFNQGDTFCIACHHGLTILDMQSIAQRMGNFFDRFLGKN